MRRNKHLRPALCIITAIFLFWSCNDSPIKDHQSTARDISPVIQEADIPFCLSVDKTICNGILVLSVCSASRDFAICITDPIEKSDKLLFSGTVSIPAEDSTCEVFRVSRGTVTALGNAVFRFDQDSSIEIHAANMSDPEPLCFIKTEAGEAYSLLSPIPGIELLYAVEESSSKTKWIHYSEPFSVPSESAIRTLCRIGTTLIGTTENPEIIAITDTASIVSSSQDCQIKASSDTSLCTPYAAKACVSFSIPCF